MRVLATVQSYFPFQDRGGPVFKVRSIAQGLSKRGHDVTILTANLGLPRNEGIGQAKFSPCKWGLHSKDERVESIYLSTFAHYRSLTLNPAVIGFSRASLRAFDVVHVFGLYDLLGPVVTYFCRRQRIPYVIEPMGMHRPIVRSIELKRLYHRLLGNAMMAGARFVVATSKQERQELLDSRISHSRVMIRRNGIDPPEALPSRGSFRNQRGIAADTKIVLFLGRLVSKKSPDLLLRAFANWRSKDPQNQNSTLVLAGPDEGDGFTSQLKLLANELQITQNTLFVGPLYDAEKWQAYRDADVFVLPSQNENFGNTALEAAACGAPVIVTDQCGVASYVRAAGVVIRHDLAELEQALDRILSDPDFRSTCQDRCFQMVGGLSWEEPLNETEQLYQRCLSRPVLQEAAF
jgi:glycosyltransferase involved in cell wall biosynthesis